jgi:hypothetical protein
VTYKATAVVAHSFSFPDFTFSMNVSGAVTTADVGKAVTLDRTTPNTVKLAGNNDVIYGRLESVETGGLDGLTIGAVSRKFRAVLPTDGTAITVGDSVDGGATAGTVKAQVAADSVDRNVVLEVLTGNRVVVEQL